MRDEGLELSLEGRKRTRRVEEKAREGRRGGEMRGLTSGLLAEAEERGRWAQRAPAGLGDLSSLVSLSPPPCTPGPDRTKGGKRDDAQVTQLTQ